MGQALGQSTTMTRGRSPARNHGRPRGGSLRTSLQSALFMLLLCSGLVLWLRREDAAVLWLHVGGGLGFLALFAPWIGPHLKSGLAHSRRPAFTQVSWALLASWLILLASGLLMALPALLWLAGSVWFPPRAVSGALSFLHYWSSIPGMAGLLLHLGMRHWVWGGK